MCGKIEASFRVASLWSTFSSMLLICVVTAQQMDIPDKLDPFLELLFETAECEPVVADATFLVVETRKCKPFTCNFPFEVCMRPSNLINEEKSNQCRPCITAANGGRPIPRSSSATSTLSPTPPSTRIIGSMNSGTESSIAPNDGDDLEGDFDGSDGDTDIAKVIPTVMPKTEKPTVGTAGLSRPNRLHKLATICEQGIPNGRFCGFQLKFTFNRATGNCEQFWFPGCRTEETNDNLFDGLQQCQIATRHCRTQPQRPEPRALPSQGSSQSQIPFLGSFVGENGNGGNQFARSFMELAGSALGNNNGGQVSQIGRAIGGDGRNEYGGGELGGRSVAPSQQPTLIGFIANTIRDVGNGAQKGGTAQGGNGAAVFTNLLQQFG
ncbi:BPTI/Kunitz inhibitor domain-containing protein [Aphelenchoides besseyi]|nr:BPTI/Kunitz inhibitor domain-containing protein [Aphelenchoides besseyi]